MKTLADYRNAVDPFLAKVAGMARRMIVKASARAIWQLGGFNAPDLREEIKAELFGGIGFHARPSRTGKPEAIVLMINGDARTPAIVAVRDEKTRAAIASALAEDETAAFNSKAIVHIKADGTIHARSANGVAVPLATAAEVQALAAHFYGHGHLSNGAPPIASFSGPPPPSPPLLVDPGQPGTTKLRGE